MSAAIEILQSTRAFAARPLSAFIDGAFVGNGSALRDVMDPATGDVLARVADADASTVSEAVASAAVAFADGRWSGRAPAERERVLLRLAELIEANGEELAQLETLNQGKSIALSRFFDVGWSSEYARFVAGLPSKVTGDTFDFALRSPQGSDLTAMTRREPVGVVAGIAPWNFPLAIALWKILPALAAGCTAVLKPSELTPLTALRLAELAIDAGLPAGCLNVVPGDGSTGAALANDPRIAKISFTGSVETGKQIGHAASQTLARCTLELGGKNPAIFCEDVDVDVVLPAALMSAYMNQGQVCAAASRFYVHRAIVDRLVNAIGAAIGGMSVGAGMDADAQVTPLVSATHRDKVAALIDTARGGRGAVIQGVAAPERGFFISPYLIVDPPADSRIQCEEVFGPVITVTPFDDYSDVVDAANNTPFGLGASIWTNDLGRSMRMARKVRAGTVWINTHSILDPAMPFGGFKQSGIGREFGKDALLPFLETKSICIATAS
jgi:phenylacetaldehyde dehydrogenase